MAWTLTGQALASHVSSLAKSPGVPGYRKLLRDGHCHHACPPPRPRPLAGAAQCSPYSPSSWARRLAALKDPIHGAPRSVGKRSTAGDQPSAQPSTKGPMLCARCCVPRHAAKLHAWAPPLGAVRGSKGVQGSAGSSPVSPGHPAAQVGPSVIPTSTPASSRARLVGPRTSS